MFFESFVYSVLPDGSGRAFLRQDKFEDDSARGASAVDKDAYERRRAAKEAAAAAAAAAEEDNIHESPGQKIKRQLGLTD